MSATWRASALKFALAALVTAVVSHIAVVNAAPTMLMGAAMERIGAGATNAWAHGARVTETSRGVVRPSPDLAYSACVYDLSRGPVRITAGAWDAYMSLSLYSADSDNYFVLSDREAPNGIDIVLVQHARDAPDDANQVVVSPSRRGVAIVRRLAPSPDRFAAADRARQNDVCARINR